MIWGHFSLRIVIRGHYSTRTQFFAMGYFTSCVCVCVCAHARAPVCVGRGSFNRRCVCGGGGKDGVIKL